MGACDSVCVCNKRSGVACKSALVSLVGRWVSVRGWFSGGC